MSTPHFVYPLIHREHLGCFHFGAIMNNAALNVRMQVLTQSNGPLDNAGIFLTPQGQSLSWKNLCEPCLRIMERVIKLICYSWEAKIVVEGVRRSQSLSKGFSHFSLSKAGQDPNGANWSFPRLIYTDAWKNLFSYWGCYTEKMLNWHSLVSLVQDVEGYCCQDLFNNITKCLLGTRHCSRY